MNRTFLSLLLVVAALAVVQLNFTDNVNRKRSLRILTQRRIDSVKEQRRRVVEVLTHENETLSATLSNAAHSYCDGDDLSKYPLPEYNACPPDSVLNIIPFVGGMTTGLKHVLLGALMSFQENRCFTIDEDSSHLRNKSGSFANLFSEDIGLPHNSTFVKKAMTKGRYEVRDWRQWWGNYMLRRLKGARYNYQTFAYNHSDYGVDGLELKRDFLRHMWHLRPSYRELTCQALKDQDIFDTEYIALSIRRGDTGLKVGSFKPMSEYIKEAERLVPMIFSKGQKPKLFVATDDCTVVDTLRKARPQWIFKSQCDQLSKMQTGYNDEEITNLSEEEREEHYRKLFVELYALALSKVFIGVSYTNVSWFAYMMRPNVDKSTFILLDYINDPLEIMHDPTGIW